LLHVNRGLGTSGQRVRIGAPREITLVTLLAADVAATA
jgi:predicted MPP superfamily phosphohydrolase